MKEIRSRASIEARALTAKEKQQGYIGAIRGEIPYNKDSALLTKRGRRKPFFEQLAPGVFDRSIAEDRDIMANAGHTTNPLAALAKVGANLDIRSDEQGITWEALLPDTQVARDLLNLIEKRIITGTSFEFEVDGEDGETWESRDASIDQRIIKRAKLLALNPVIWPAYPDSALTVEARGRYEEGEERGCYGVTSCCWEDNPPSPDVRFALRALDRAVWLLSDALEYQRDQPAGAHAEFAKAKAADAAAEIATLAAWLEQHGAEVAETVMTRAKTTATAAREKYEHFQQEKREEPPADRPETQPEPDRERRLRILKLRSL